MCGIFGYIGKKEAPSKIHNGLKRLEYRGYDSWGIATLSKDGISLQKETGAITTVDENLLETNSAIGIGHTRWATHGGVTETNAHPHLSTDERFSLAQNGIVENYQELKEMLAKEYPFHSQTDTEVIVRLIEKKLKEAGDDNLAEAIRMAFLDLEGRNSIIVLDSKNDQIIAIRNGSPLVVGILDDEYYIASDTLSFSDQTNQVAELDNYDMVVIDEIKGVTKLDAKTGKGLDLNAIEIDIEESRIDKEGYDHFMIKEIIEQKETIRNAVQYSEDDLKPLLKAIKEAENVYTVGAGTASYAAGQIAWMLRQYADIPAETLKSYEIGSYVNQFSDKDLMIAVSQSGETADTIEALELAQEKGVKIASIVNMVSSTTTRMSDISYLTRSGPEICVASTKAFTAQIAWGLLVTMSLIGKYDEAISAIEEASKFLESYFTKELFDQINRLAKKIKDQEHFFVLGRERNFQISLEAALKVKEITYKHFEGFTAGELKHGVIALIEKGTPVFAIISEDEYKNDMLSAVAEVKARDAFVVAVADEDNELFDFHLQSKNLELGDPIVKIVPFQLLSYYLGVQLGCDPDKPRNLAKSVTVK